MVRVAREEMIAGTATAGEALAVATDTCAGIDSLESPQMLRLIAGLRDRPV